MLHGYNLSKVNHEACGKQAPAPAPYPLTSVLNRLMLSTLPFEFSFSLDSFCDLTREWLMLYSVDLAHRAPCWLLPPIAWPHPFSADISGVSPASQVHGVPATWGSGAASPAFYTRLCSEAQKSQVTFPVQLGDCCL